MKRRKQKASGSCDRRAFLKYSALAAGGAIGFPTIVPSSVFGQNAPSNRIVIGCIGIGGMGMGNLRGFLGQPNTQIVSVCDVDRKHLDKALQTAGLTASSGTTDFREVISRPDIDVIVNSTPDHWHVPIAIAAVTAGKDVYCEKPLTLTLGEGRLLADAVKRHNRVFQTGSHQRSDATFRRACEMIRNGRIGKLRDILVEIPPNNVHCSPDGWKQEPVPEELDYDFWLGPAPWAPYTRQRCHYTFRFISDYSGGQMTNWGSHHFDIAQWGHGTDMTGPIRIEGRGLFPSSGLFDTAEQPEVTYTYADGVTLRCRTGSGSGGVTFYGQEGRLFVGRGRVSAHPKSILKTPIKPGEIRLYYSDDHKGNFLDCVRSRKTPVASAEIGHRSASICHLGNIAMLLGRPLQWDPLKEEFIHNDQANRMRFRVMRDPWKLNEIM